MTCSRNMWLFLVAAVLVLRGPLGASAADSPCPDVFQYAGSPGSEYGIITVPNPYPFLAIDISVSLYFTARLPSNGRTTLNPVDDAMWQKLAAGSRDPVLYRIEFPLLSPLPTIKSITVNNNVICTGSRPSASYVTSLTIQHTVYNRACSSASLDCPYNIQTSSDVRPQPPAPPPPKPAPQPPSDVTRCGISDVISNALILNGKDATPGEWPWHAALYLQQGTDTNYRCGGSVIGPRTIITAAHCVTNRNGNPLSPDGFTVGLGRYDLTKRKEEGSQQKDVQRILPHPAYNYRTLDADVALLILDSSIEYTFHVRPVCLWNPSDTSIESIVGLDGVVIGWGLDEHGLIAQSLKMVITPIVSRDACKTANEEFFLAFVHTNNFCAGFANGSTPCNGDSGGGMVIPGEWKGDRWVYRLRGIVSNTRPVDKIKKTCDPNSYIVFTDVAKYLQWINSNLF